MNTEFEQFIKLCLVKNIKLTSQRKIIGKALAESDDHPDAEELYLRANALDSNISLATVYRTLSLFENAGLITKLEIGEGKARYELMKSKNDHHHHLIDLETGKIIEFYDEEIEVLKEKIAKRLGYKLICHKLELYGIPLEEK